MEATKMATTNARTGYRATVRRLRGALALAATLALAAPATATTTIPQTLSPEPGKATIFLEPPGDAVDVIRQLELERGKSTFLRTGYSVKRVSVGNPEILDVVVLSGSELQLVAKAVGTTNMLVWDPRGRLQAAIDIHIGSAQSALQAELRRLLENEEIYVENAGHATVLKGTVSSVVAMEQALDVARAFLGEEQGQIVNLLEVGGNQQVMLKVTVAEMSRSVSREFGTNFNALIDAGSGNIEIFNFIGGLTQLNDDGTLIQLSDAVNLAALFTGFGALEQLAVFLDALDERGLAKVLAEPTLVARSGEQASFLVGGEVPIPIAQGGAFGSITVEFKSFGVGLGFTPTVLGPERIHLEVAPEVSEPDFTIGTEAGGTIVPGFVTRRAATAVELKDGQSFAIAGLLSDQVRQLTGRYPLLGQIPVLGNLFRSSRYQKNQTELVVIVTPHLVRPLGPEPHALPTDSFIEPNALEFYLLGRQEGYGHASAQPGGLIGDVGHRVTATPEGGTE
jgi:pilus assembly protein CpaC